jgi:hypothetical protein
VGLDSKTQRDIEDIARSFYKEFAEKYPLAAPYFAGSGIGERTWFDKKFRKDVSREEALLLLLTKRLPWGVRMPDSYEGVRIRKMVVGEIGLYKHRRA